jgi:hypothetical protein
MARPGCTKGILCLVVRAVRQQRTFSRDSLFNSHYRLLGFGQPPGFVLSAAGCSHASYSICVGPASPFRQLHLAEPRNMEHGRTPTSEVLAIRPGEWRLWRNTPQSQVHGVSTRWGWHQFDTQHRRGGCKWKRRGRTRGIFKGGSMHCKTCVVETLLINTPAARLAELFCN